jgi:hypothetical protein
MAVALYKKLSDETSPEFMEMFEKNIETINELFREHYNNFGFDLSEYKHLIKNPPPFEDYVNNFKNNDIANKILNSENFKTNHKLEINRLNRYSYELKISFTNNNEKFILNFYSEWDGEGSTNEGVIIDSVFDSVVVDDKLVDYLKKIKQSLNLSCSEFKLYETLWNISIYGTPINNEIPYGFEEYYYKYH